MFRTKQLLEIFLITHEGSIREGWIPPEESGATILPRDESRMPLLREANYPRQKYRSHWEILHFRMKAAIVPSPVIKEGEGKKENGKMGPIISPSVK